jgi:hypothetical protein
MRKTTKLLHWTPTSNPFLDDRFVAPECKQICIGGEIADDDHPEFHKGAQIISSPIVSVVGRLVETQSGSFYELIGEPDSFFKDEVLPKHNEKYNEEEPISFLFPEK